MRSLKNKEGITLIALVITIIVLLILAGVAIAMLSGENGILKKAAEAKTKTGEGKEYEETALATAELETYFRTNNLKYKCSNGFITGFDVKESIEDFEKVIKPLGYKVTLKYKYNMSSHTGEYVAIEESEKNRAYIATGMIIEKDEKKLSTVIFGDINCDGETNITDRSYFPALYNKYSEIDLIDSMKISMDLNCDGKINSTDKGLFVNLQFEQQQYAQDPNKIEKESSNNIEG